jgi:hypothetical protein
LFKIVSINFNGSQIDFTPAVFKLGKKKFFNNVFNEKKQNIGNNDDSNDNKNTQEEENGKTNDSPSSTERFII